MSYTDFIKPYENGYVDGEIGNTPVTAEILNTNYDGFLIALNSWADEIEEDISGIIANVGELGNEVEGKSTVSFNQVLQSGTKIGTITIDNSPYDIYAPNGGSGGSSVSWNQIVNTGTKIATITIDGVPTDVYAPTSGGSSSFSGLSDVSVSNPSEGQVPVYNATTSKWENGTIAVGDDVSFTQIQSTGTKIGTITINNVDFDIYAPNGGGGASAFEDLTDVDIDDNTLANGQVPKWNSTTQKWENANESGGHTIENDAGTSLTQRSALQFKGTYVHDDDSTNNASIVEVTRKMTKTEFNLLSAEEKKGIIVITDEAEPSGTSWVDVTGTLDTGETEITLSHSSITTSSTIDIYTDSDICYNSIEVTDGSVTITFDEQEADVEVKARITVNNGGYTDVLGTLAAGSTSITLTNDCITTSSNFDVYTDVFGINPTNISASAGSVTLTFPAQQAALGVKVRVS